MTSANGIPKGAPESKGMIVQADRALIVEGKTGALGVLRKTLITLVLITEHRGAAAGSE